MRGISQTFQVKVFLDALHKESGDFALKVCCSRSLLLRAQADHETKQAILGTEAASFSPMPFVVETLDLPGHGPGGVIAVKTSTLPPGEIVEVGKGSTFIRISQNLDALNHPSGHVVGPDNYQQSFPLYISSYPSSIPAEHPETQGTPWTSTRFIASWLVTPLSTFVLFCFVPNPKCRYSRPSL